MKFTFALPVLVATIASAIEAPYVAISDIRIVCPDDIVECLMSMKVRHSSDNFPVQCHGGADSSSHMLPSINGTCDEADTSFTFERGAGNSFISVEKGADSFRYVVPKEHIIQLSSAYTMRESYDGPKNVVALPY